MIVPTKERTLLEETTALATFKPDCTVAPGLDSVMEVVPDVAVHIKVPALFAEIPAPDTTNCWLTIAEVTPDATVYIAVPAPLEAATAVRLPSVTDEFCKAAVSTNVVLAMQI